VDALYSRFIDLVAKCRLKPPEAIRATEAAVYRGDQAVAAGLADKVGTLRVALADLGAVLARPTVSRPIAARLGVTIDPAEAMAKGIRPEALRRTVLDQLAECSDATDVAAAAPAGAVPKTETESPIVRRAREAAARK
jgi:capsid assembly protease